MCSWTLLRRVLGMYNAKVVIVGPSGVGKVNFIAGRIIVCTEIRPPDEHTEHGSCSSRLAVHRAKHSFSTPLEGSQMDTGPR